MHVAWAIDLAHINWGEVAFGAGLSIALLVGSVAVTALVLVRLPHDHFSGPTTDTFWIGRPRWQRILGRIGKNALGVLLVAAGAIMALPGVPGQGLLTMLIGLLLLDFPGKHALERRIVASPRIFRAVNNLRARFKRAPFDAPVRVSQVPAEPL